MKDKYLFPLVPAAIEFWEKGLQNVEEDLLKKSGRELRNQKGYDAVYLVNKLSYAYKSSVYSK